MIKQTVKQGRRERGLGGDMAPLGFYNITLLPLVFLYKKY
jgi:hypothetical protein